MKWRFWRRAWHENPGLSAETKIAIAAFKKMLETDDAILNQEPPKKKLTYPEILSEAHKRLKKEKCPKCGVSKLWGCNCRQDESYLETITRTYFMPELKEKRMLKKYKFTTWLTRKEVDAVRSLCRIWGREYEEGKGETEQEEVVARPGDVVWYTGDGSHRVVISWATHKNRNGQLPASETPIPMVDPEDQIVYAPRLELYTKTKGGTDYITKYEDD